MSTDKETVDSYSNYAEQWATRMRSGENIAHEYLEKPAMYKRLPDLKGKSVLAVGCGTGEECAHLKSLGASKVVGIDVSEGLIEYARKSYPDIEFHVMDMEQIDLDEKFDFVYSSLVMHYVESWNKTLNSIAAVMKDGATLLFSTHHPATWGAQRTRTEGERTSLLGYKKLKKNQECEVIGDYLNTRKINDVWFGNFDVSYYHRSLESILTDILASNFQIVDFAEPKAVPAAKEKDKVFYEIHDKIPLFMIFALQKK
ncbi:MAG: class I SAM-dependent methyltransferase [Candidatus Paceibacterota bacterium]